MRAKISCCIFTLALTGCFKTGVETATSVQNLPSCEGTCAAGFACDLKSNQCVFVGFSGQDAGDSLDLDSFGLDIKHDVPKDTGKKDSGIKVSDAGPCNGICKNGDKCDPTNHKCYVPCKLTNSWALDVQKITKLSIAPANQGCDLNDDGKPDNAIGKALASFKQFDEAFSKGIADGSWVWLLEAAAPGYASDGSQFHINLFSGVADPKIPFCDYASQTGNCGYLVDAADYDGNSSADPCPAMQVTKNAMINAGELNAFLPVFHLQLPKGFSDGSKILINQAKLSGTVQDAVTWKSTSAGRICGYVLVADLQSAAQPSLVKCDIISANSPDGLPDACSIALDFETAPGQITGYK